MIASGVHPRDIRTRTRHDVGNRREPAMRRSAVRRVALSKVRVFESFPRRELILLARLADEVHFEAGEAIIREGRFGSEFYVILRGQVCVDQGGTRVATMGPGDHFGELAVLSPGPRTAGVTALTPVTALVLTSRGFEQARRDVPELADIVMRRMAQRLRDATSGVGS